VVYPNSMLDAFIEEMIDSCDIDLSDKLQNILSVSSLVEVRNDFELRISNYFESNIRD